MRKSVHLPTPLVAPVLMLSLVLLLPVVVSGQEKSYTIETDSYVIEFPTHTWKAVPDPRPGLTVYANGDSGEDGFLVIRLSGEGGIDIPEFARYDLHRNVGPSVSGITDLTKETDFRRGMVFTYEYKRANKPMAGRVYYISLPCGRYTFSAGDTCPLWVLRFTGERDKLQRIQDQMDAIARSFRLKD